ncbi:hypothetical protein [Pseudoalteromonas sp. 1CM17D]|uniref:hypothetical protein n=1 Tax=Pseudoalteromonas sp. 1CM17D TaxID=2929162 RepID=UPI0020BD94B8|nr:hypothetical protein [Pseudoalteromonas sp. 1CM17D]MCK8094689.1 hypothetical protein [Pseudoalteromonas sp. 1CM17D]
MSTPNLSITPQERALFLAEDLEGFWLSRLRKMDPVARIGYALWVSNTEKLKREIEKGNPLFWNNKGFVYWEFMARSTVVNLAAGLEKGGFRGTFLETRNMIKRVGLEVAKQHIKYVHHDYQAGNIGKVKGLLSLKQMADYHHEAFRKFNIPPSFYGGTWLDSVPNEAEFKLYGDLYCHDCDSNTNYQRPAQ